VLTISDGVVSMPYYELYISVQNIYIFTICISLSYWQFLTAWKSPKSLKYVTKWLYFGGIITILGGIFVFLEAEFFVFMFITVILTAFIDSVCITKEPKLVHLLPFTVYRLIITSKNGLAYYVREWSAIDINTDMMSGMISAINTFSKNTLTDKQIASNISEVKLEKGILLTELRFSPVNIMLMASKASQNLKDSMNAFAMDFTSAFSSYLRDKDGFPLDVQIDKIPEIFTHDAVEPIIEKYFSNVPDYMVASENLENIIEKHFSKTNKETASINLENQVT